MVVKHNKLIEAQGRLTALEQKLFLSVVAQVRVTDEDFKEYVITVDEMINSFGIDSTNVYRVAMDTANRIMDVPIRIKEGKKHLVTRLFSSAQYVDGKGYVSLRFDPSLKPYLLQLSEQFTQYELRNVLEINSSHAIKIYELLKQYQKIKKRTFEIDELKLYLGIEGKYSVFKDFERRVLKVAKEEINSKTDIQIDYKKLKNGRKITRVEFEIHGFSDSENKGLGELYDIESMKNKMGITDIILSNKQVMTIYELACDYADEDGDPYEYVKKNYEYIIDQNPKNPYAYLKKALIEDFAQVNYQIRLIGYEGE